MDGAMVRSAERDEIFGVVVAAFGAKPDVVRLDERGVSAAGDATLPAVSMKHGTAGCRRDGL